MADFTGKTAVVTGGGGPNIGRAISIQLASAGADVVIVDIDVEAAEKTTAKINDAPGQHAAFFECDVTDVNAVSDTIADIAAEFESIDILVNNAGGATGVQLPDINESEFEYNIDVNLKSAFFTTQAALPYLTDADTASVVFVSSINALLGGFSEVAYSVAKAGLHSLARGLTADHSGDGVRFNVVCPGSVIGNSDTWKEREQTNPGTKQRIHDLYPTGRYGQPDDVAHAVTFLASDRAAWISGVTLPVDGGLTATGGLPGGRWWEKI